MRNKIIIGGIVLLVIAGSIWYQKHAARVDERTTAAQTTEEPKQPAINGVEVYQSIAHRRPLAVVIENHPDSRPQSGLTDADIVYETLTEGGITRFLALFQTRDVENIGPVRSARPTFLFLVNQWAGVFTHVGGSEQALKEIRTNVFRNVTDIDEFYNGKYFRRAADRTAPHNTYTSTQQLREYVQSKKAENWTPGTFWNFKTIPTHELKPTITKLTIPFSTASYKVDYTFDPATNTYKRLVGGKAAIDRNNQQQISPSNVLLQFTDVTYVPISDTTSASMELDQSGTLVLFTGGDMIDGKWRYEKGELIYTDKEGKPLTLQPGQTWIELVPKSLITSVSWQ